MAKTPEPFLSVRVLYLLIHDENVKIEKLIFLLRIRHLHIQNPQNKICDQICLL